MRHTTRCVTTTHSPVQGGGGGYHLSWGYPLSWVGCHPVLARGYPLSLVGVPPHLARWWGRGTPCPGCWGVPLFWISPPPPCRTWNKTLDRTSDRNKGSPRKTPGTRDYGPVTRGIPPCGRRDRQTPVKTLPSRRNTHARVAIKQRQL